MPSDKERERGPVKREAIRRRPAHTPRASAFEGERIAKVMARVGLCSRRDAEDWVRAGRVAVNGAVLADPAVNVTDADHVTVDGRPLAAREKTRLFLFNKPRGLVTTDHDPEGRPTVFAYLAHHHPHLPRLISIGRLDITSEGLLLLSNDGGLARVLELPATGWLRRYRVRAHGQTTPDAVAALKKGITIEGVDYQPIEATLDRVQGANTWLTVALREGKNREVRRVLEHLGLEVNRLIRLSYGPFQLGEAPDGAVEEVRTRVLIDQLGPTLIAQAGADFSDLRREEEQAYRAQQDAAAAPPQKRERPVAGKRKHVSALRSEREETRGRGPRVRIERAATEDRRGRTVAIERVRLTGPKTADATTRNGRRFRDEGAPERPRVSRGTRAPFQSREGRSPQAAPIDDHSARPRHDDRETSQFAGPREHRTSRGAKSFDAGKLGDGKSGAGKPRGIKTFGSKPGGGKFGGGRPGVARKPGAFGGAGKSGSARPAGRPHGAKPGGRPRGPR